MLQVHDIRDSRVYREAMEEGKEEGKKEMAARTIVILAAQDIPMEEIASKLEVDIKFVRQVLKAPANG